MNPSSLQNIAPELLARIVLYAVADDDYFLGPPTDVLSLILTSRSIHSAISLSRNIYLQAQIFRLKFDHAAPCRRLSPRWSTCKSLASELRKRCDTLKRIRDGDIHGPHVLADLWTAFLMMLENDGMNERQLLDWARFPAFLRKLVRSMTPINRTHCPRSCVDVSCLPLVAWLLWLTSNAGMSFRILVRFKAIPLDSLRYR